MVKVIKRLTTISRKGVHHRNLAIMNSSRCRCVLIDKNTLLYPYTHWVHTTVFPMLWPVAHIQRHGVSWDVHRVHSTNGAEMVIVFHRNMANPIPSLVVMMSLPWHTLHQSRVNRRCIKRWYPVRCNSREIMNREMRFLGTVVETRSRTGHRQRRAIQEGVPVNIVDYTRV